MLPNTVLSTYYLVQLCYFVVFLFLQNDDEGSDFDLPPSWVAPIEISLKGDRAFFHVFGNGVKTCHGCLKYFEGKL